MFEQLIKVGQISIEVENHANHGGKALNPTHMGTTLNRTPSMAENPKPSTTNTHHGETTQTLTTMAEQN